MPPTRFAVLTGALLLSVLIGPTIVLSGAPAKSPVDPAVWQDCENGGTAHFLILLKDQTDTKSNGKPNADRKARRSSVVDSLRETAERSQLDLRKTLARGGVDHRPYWIINMIAAEGKRGLVEALSTRDDVQAIEADRPVLVAKPQPEQPEPALLLATPQSPAAVEPNLTRIRAPDLWALGFTGQGIVYADADTGVQWDHPALKNHYRGWNGASADHNYNWWDAIHNDINGNGTNPIGFNARIPGDDDIHGTHTMGIGVGGDAAANQIGVAPGAKWICCRNMEQGVGRPSTYIECMQFFLAPTDLDGNNPDPERGADTVGNSYGCPPDELCAPNSLHLMLENLRAAGIFMAVAAGNDGPNCSTINDPPALDAAVVTVGATDNSDVIASFSSRGPVTVDGSGRRKPDLVAPGVSVRSSVPGNSYNYLNGTSMAAPHVAGAVALLWSAFPHIRGNIEYTESILEQSAVHLTSTEICGTNNGVPNNVFGYGRIDLLAAYNAVNRPPIANNMALAIEGDRASRVTLVGSDPENALLTFHIVQTPTNGLLSVISANSEGFTYTPAHSFVGSDTIVFNVSDGMFASSNAVLRITITQPADTDHDGIPDSWEIAHSLNPADSADGSLDNDGDGRTNFQEYVANTNPQQSNSVFRITGAIRDASGHNVVSWTTSGGTRYRLQFVDRNPPDAWNFADLVRSIGIEMDSHAIGSPSAMSFVDDYSLTGTPAPGTSRYYRIRVVR